MSLAARRILLVIISLAVGVGALFGVFGFLNLVYDAGVGFHNYDPVYVIFTVLPMAIFAGVWLDYFLKTGLLPEGRDE
ncbi:MAG: hypothetical protein Kow00124_09720 [Anaerolineae bacterium]